MRISAKADYAVRAALELTASNGILLKSEAIADAQDIPHRYLEQILPNLRSAGIVVSQRGAAGGHALARAASEISIADVIRAVDGPLVYVRDDRPGEADYHGAAKALPGVWLALRESVRNVLDVTMLADVVS